MSTILHRDRDDGPQPYRVITTSFDVNSLLYLADGRLVSGSSVDGTVTFWNVEEGKQERTFLLHNGDEMFDFALTGDGKKIIGDWEGGVKVLDVESDQVVKEWFDKFPPVAVSPDNRLVAVGSKERIFIHAIEGWQVKQTFEVDKDPLRMSFSPAGNKLACSTKFDIHVYDVDSGTLILGPLDFGYGKPILWSRDGSRLFSAPSWEETIIHCWNANTGKQIGHPWTGHDSWIFSLSLSPDGSILVSASWDKTVRFWNATTGDQIGQPLRHQCDVLDVYFSPSGRSMASTTDDEIYLWQVPRLDTVEGQVCKSIHFGVLALISYRRTQPCSTQATHMTRAHSHLRIPCNFPALRV